MHGISEMAKDAFPSLRVRLLPSFFHTYPTPIYLARISLWKVYRVVNKVYDGVLRVGCY